VIPQNLRFGGGVQQTIIHPAVAIAVLIAGLLICFLPRKKAVLPFLAAAILIPTDQILLIGGLHFPMLRVLILFGFARMLRTKISSGFQVFSGGLNRLDLTVILLAVSIAIAGLLLWQQSAVVVFQLGELYSAFGVYFLLRFLIRDQDDVERTIRTLAYIAVVVAGIMSYEQATGSNPYYASLGGSLASVYGSAMERDGRFRATGCFAHPILAGTFGGILLPLFFGLWWKAKQSRKCAVLGMVAATVIAAASNSSTPLFAYIGGLVGLCFWPLRRQMRVIRWGIVTVIVSLHMVMKAPVWHLISRVDLTGGSSSYHRYQLVDMFIRHFWDWWLVGTKSNADWGWDMWDLSNQYVGTGEASGVIAFILFVAVIVYGFKYLGKARKACAGEGAQEIFMWSLGAAVFANAVAFFGISYFDQTIVAWYALLAMISAAAVPVIAHRRESRQVLEPRRRVWSAIELDPSSPEELSGWLQGSAP